MVYLKKQIQYNKKCYMIDSALISTIGFRVSEDKGQLLENIVFLHLKMRGYEIYFHKRQKEYYFVIRENNLISQAVQVSLNLSNDKLTLCATIGKNAFTKTAILYRECVK